MAGSRDGWMRKTIGMENSRSEKRSPTLRRVWIPGYHVGVERFGIKPKT